MNKIFMAAMSLIFNVCFVGVIICSAINLFSIGDEWRGLANGFTLICFWPLYFISSQLKTDNLRAKNLLSRIYDWSHYKDSPYMKEVQDFLQ
jgi:hypothetical protein